MRPKPSSKSRAVQTTSRFMSTALAALAAFAPARAFAGPGPQHPAPSNSLDTPPLEPFQGLTTAAVLAGTPVIAEEQGPRLTGTEARRFDVPAAPLADVIKEFERVTGVTVELAEPALGTIPSPGVVGTHSANAALGLLLAQTGLSFRVTGPTTVLVEVRTIAESVDVEGRSGRNLATPKLTGPLRDLPVTVNVVTAEVMRTQNATSLRDVLRNVPGITMQAGEGGGGLPGDSLTLRGFSATNDIFVDGVRDVAPYSRDTFNLEQVEVVKGPAGSIAGRGATGGSINMVTKSPNLQPGYSVQMGGGNAGYFRTTADINQPLEGLGKGTALRLNAMWQDSNVPGRDVVENGSWAIAPSLALGVGTRSRAILTYQHLEQDNVPDYGLPWAAFEATPEVEQSTFYGLRNYDFEDINNDIATVRLEHDVRPGLTLRNTTRYGDTVRDSAITAPRPPNRQLQRRWMANTAIGNLTTVNATARTGSIGHDLAGGIELLSERSENRNSAQNTNQPQTTLIGPNPNDRPFGPMPDITGNPSRAKTNTIGTYLFDTVSLGTQWQVNGGLRVDWSDVDYSLTTLATGDVTELTRNDTLVTGRAGVVYKPVTNASIYAAFGTSANPSADAGNTGTALSDVPTNANNINLKPERTKNLEAGTKWDVIGERLQLTAAVFRTEKTNARTRNLTSDPFVLSGRQRVNGVEFGASGAIRDGWTVLAGFSFMDSDIAASANPDEVDANLALVPEKSMSLWTTANVWRGLSIGGGVQFQDNVFRNAVNTLQVPGYWLVNTMASYTVNRNLTLRINGTNLADAQYVDRVGGGHYIPGARRQIVVSTDVRF